MDYHALFVQLDSFLVQHQAVWRYQPFKHMTDSLTSDYPWQDKFSPLSCFLDSISNNDIEQLRANSHLASQLLDPFFPQLVEVRQAITFAASHNESGFRMNQLAPDYTNGIPGRKQAQLEAMVNAVVSMKTNGLQWLEWCAGKGYLGRILASLTEKKVVSFEYQESLCEAGKNFAKQHLLPITFVQGDAFLPSSKLAIEADAHALALHACGDLHVRLIEYGVALKLPAITVAPCCYHLIQSDRYVPMSEAYLCGAQINLTKEELRIPLQETVTGGERVKRHRQLEMIYRLGVDLIFREQFADRGYTPVPSVKKSLLANGFKHFANWAAQRQGRELDELDWDNYYVRAENKFYQMEKITLVQQQFYSILETWIVLDKVFYLQQHGYHVRVEPFCEKSVTPRNLLIHGWLS
jgi:hypothetical protein